MHTIYAPIGPAPGAAVTKIKTTKINSGASVQLITKFNTPENYQPYGMCNLSVEWNFVCNYTKASRQHESSRYLYKLSVSHRLHALQEGAKDS